MTKPINISVYAIVSSPYCVASGDGEKIFERVEAGFREGRQVVLSFRNVTSLTSAFLNAAVGQLYGTFSESKVSELLSFEEIAPEDEDLIRRVQETAKVYFRDRARFEAAVREEMGDSEDGE